VKVTYPHSTRVTGDGLYVKILATQKTKGNKIGSVSRDFKK